MLLHAGRNAGGAELIEKREEHGGFVTRSSATESHGKINHRRHPPMRGVAA
jgi:hypothetical protein